MKPAISTLFGLLLASGISQATTISVTGAANSTARGTADLGDVLTTTLIGDNTPVGAGQPLSITVSNLNIDGSGGNNDSVVLTFTVTTDGQNIQTSGTGAAGWLSSGPNTQAGAKLDADGEFVQLDLSSITVDLNGIAGSGTGISGESFLGFTGVTFGSWGAGDTATANDITVTRDTSANENRFIDLTPDGNDANLKSSWTTGVDAGAWRPENFDFQFEVNTVPEPSTLMLLGLGGLAVLRRRR